MRVAGRLDHKVHSKRQQSCVSSTTPPVYGEKGGKVPNSTYQSPVEKVILAQLVKRSLPSIAVVFNLLCLFLFNFVPSKVLVHNSSYT